MSDEEGKLLRNIEEEVRKLLSERSAKKVSKKQLVVHYFKSVDRFPEDRINELLEKGVTLIALRGNALKSVGSLTKKLLENVRNRKSSIYLLKWPTLLIIGDEIELKVYE